MIDGLILSPKYLLLLQHINHQDYIRSNILLITQLTLLILASGVIFSLKCGFSHRQRLASDSRMKNASFRAAQLILKAFLLLFLLVQEMYCSILLYFSPLRACLGWNKERGRCRDGRRHENLGKPSCRVSAEATVWRN